MPIHPECQTRLRREIEENISNKRLGELEAHDLSPEKTPYLEAMVHETLRASRTNIGFSRRSESIFGISVFSLDL